MFFFSVTDQSWYFAQFVYNMTPNKSIWIIVVSETKIEKLIH